MRVFHETPEENASSIIREGFVDGGREPRGVFIADQRPRFRASWATDRHRPRDHG